MTEKDCSFSPKNCCCGLKIAYVLIFAIIVAMGVMCYKGCMKGGSANIEAEIFTWIKKNPKAILDSVEAFVKDEQMKMQQDQQKNSSENVKKYYDRIIDTKNTGVANPKGKKIIVEFFDYNCGYCKMASKTVAEIANENSDVKIVFREMPILGAPSLTAAQYSIAVSIIEPDKYLAFHDYLIQGNPRSKDGIIEALKQAKINVSKVEKALTDKKDEIEKRIRDNQELAQLLGLGGTPAFVVNETFIPGLVEKAQLLELLK